MVICTLIILSARCLCCSYDVRLSITVSCVETFKKACATIKFLTTSFHNRNQDLKQSSQEAWIFHQSDFREQFLKISVLVNVSELQYLQNSYKEAQSKPSLNLGRIAPVR